MATRDTTAPILLGLTFPTLIDLSKGPKDVTFGAQAQDNVGGTGVLYLAVILDYTIFYENASRYGVDIGTDSESTNTFKDSTTTTATKTITLGENVGTGVYNINYVALFDVAGNRVDYYNEQLKALGINTSFTVTDGTTDITPPILNSLSPIDNVLDVATLANLVLNFDEAIQAGTGNILIYSANGSVAKTIAVTDSSQVSISGSTVTINPNTNFTAGSGYYVNVAAGVLKDLAGNSFAGINDTTTYNFATAVPVDTTAPRLSSLSPTDNATGVANSAHLVLTFNEAIQVGTGNILIKNVDGSVAKTIAVTDNNQVSILGTTVILNPSSDLNAGSSYYVNVAAGVVKDLAGNSFAGITDTTTYNFTTAIALVEGTPLNDRLIATSQNESINGADGIDAVVYSGLRNSYTITKTNQNITITDIANSKSIDTLISIERLAFSDKNIALDLNGHAGTTAKILGAVFGADAVSNTSYAGIGLKLLDDGMSYESLMALAIDAAGAITPQAVVDLLWNNVVGGLPSNEQAQSFVDILNNGLSFGQLGQGNRI